MDAYRVGLILSFILQMNVSFCAAKKKSICLKRILLDLEYDENKINVDLEAIPKGIQMNCSDLKKRIKLLITPREDVFVSYANNGSATSQEVPLYYNENVKPTVAPEVSSNFIETTETAAPENLNYVEETELAD